MRRVSQSNENSQIKPFSIFMVNGHTAFLVVLTLPVWLFFCGSIITKVKASTEWQAALLEKTGKNIAIESRE